MNPLKSATQRVIPALDLPLKVISFLFSDLNPAVPAGKNFYNSVEPLVSCFLRNFGLMSESGNILDSET